MTLIICIKEAIWSINFVSKGQKSLIHIKLIALMTTFYHFPPHRHCLLMRSLQGSVLIILHNPDQCKFQLASIWDELDLFYHKTDLTNFMFRWRTPFCLTRYIAHLRHLFFWHHMLFRLVMEITWRLPTIQGSLQMIAYCLRGECF